MAPGGSAARIRRTSGRGSLTTRLVRLNSITGRSAALKAGLMTFPLGSRLQLDRADLDDICRFYDRIADELLTHTRVVAVRNDALPSKSVAFSRDRAHISLAIVACDGL